MLESLPCPGFGTDTCGVAPLHAFVRCTIQWVRNGGLCGVDTDRAALDRLDAVSATSLMFFGLCPNPCDLEDILSRPGQFSEFTELLEPRGSKVDSSLNTALSFRVITPTRLRPEK